MLNGTITFLKIYFWHRHFHIFLKFETVFILRIVLISRYIGWVEGDGKKMYQLRNTQYVGKYIFIKMTQNVENSISIYHKE